MVAAALWLRGDDPPVPAKPRVVATLHLTPNPAAIVSGFGSFWIADDVAGTVLRVDPGTRAVVARFRVPSASHIAITRVGDQLWTLTEGRALVVRIDPATNAVIARTPLRTPDGRRFIPFGILVRGGDVWALSSTGALRLDPATGAGLRMAQAPPESQWFALGLAHAVGVRHRRAGATGGCADRRAPGQHPRRPARSGHAGRPRGTACSRRRRWVPSSPGSIPPAAR